MQKCIHCGSEETKQIPAGVSKKTGKPYNAFFKCSGCGKTFNPPTSTAKTAYVVPAPNSKIEDLLQDISEQLGAIRVLLEMKRDNTDPDQVPF